MAARRRRHRRQQDAFGKRAKREGHAARSVYKLEEIDRRIGLLRRGHRVLDLGAAPGSWAEYAAGKVQREGRVLAVDLQPLKVSLPPHAEAMKQDVRDLDAEAIGRFDVVLSDMAPSTSGHRDVDQARSHELFMGALGVARRVLDPGGSFVGKLFQGPDFDEARNAVAESFEKVQIVKPKATRGESIELFVVGLRFRG